MRFTRTTALLAAALPIAAGIVLVGMNQSASAAGAGFPAHYLAPYLQIASSDAGDMAADMAASGDKFYTLAFITPKSGCTGEWEDGGDAVGAFKTQISSLQAAGGNVAISFGGAAGGELAQTCTSTSSLTAAYANVVNTYGVNRLDFDIEGGVISDTASTARRDSALAALQAQNPNVQVDFTLAVDPNGMESPQLNLLKDAKAKGVRVSIVNIMTMDFGDGENALNDAQSAARGSATQISSIFGVSTAQAFAMMGLTPIAGQNDDNENFTQANARTLESFAKTNGVAELSFWEVDEFDKSLGYAYSKIFQPITGGTTPPPPTTTNPAPPTTTSPTPPGGGKSYEGEAGTLGGTANVTSCTACSGGQKVSGLGTSGNGSVTISGVTESSTGNFTMTVSYLAVGKAKPATITANGVAQTVTFPETSPTSFSVVGTFTVTVHLNSGSGNTIKIAGQTGSGLGAPDLDRIVV